MPESSRFKSYNNAIYDPNGCSSGTVNSENSMPHHTIKRYHVNNGEIKEKKDTSQHSRQKNILYFEREEDEHPSRSLKMETGHLPVETNDMDEPQIKKNLARSNIIVWESNHHSENRKKLEKFQLKLDSKEKESNFEKRDKEGNSKKVNHEPSKLKRSQDLDQYKSQPDIKFLASESEIPQKYYASSSHGNRAGEKQQVDRCRLNHDNKTEHRSHRKEHEKGHSSNSTKDLIGEIIAGASASALLVNQQQKVGEGPEHPTRNILGAAALGVVGAEVLNRARNQFHHIHTDDEDSKLKSKHKHKSIKSVLGLAAAGLAAAAVANQYSHDHKAKNEGGYKNHIRAPSKSKAPKAQDSKNISCSVYSLERKKYEDSSNRSKSIPDSEPEFVTACATAENRRSQSRSRSRTRSKSRIMKNSQDIDTCLSGAAADLFERCNTPEENERYTRHFKRESCEHSRHRSRSSTRARGKNAFSDLSPDSESKMIEYGSDPIYLTGTSPTQIKKNCYSSTHDAYRNSNPLNYSHQRRGSSPESLNLKWTRT